MLARLIPLFGVGVIYYFIRISNLKVSLSKICLQLEIVSSSFFFIFYFSFFIYFLFLFFNIFRQITLFEDLQVKIEIPKFEFEFDIVGFIA